MGSWQIFLSNDLAIEHSANGSDRVLILAVINLILRRLLAAWHARIFARGRILSRKKRNDHG
jgi:hypothetical protein